MPIKRGHSGSRSYYSWGDNGKKYYYSPGSERARSLAKRKAHKQGVAIKTSQSRRASSKLISSY